MVGSTSLRAEMMLLEIKEFASDLDCREVEEVPYRLNLYVGQGTVEAEEAVLENIVGRLPTS
jgi:hypothetical protein